MNEQNCRKTRRFWKERHAVMVQIPFRVDLKYFENLQNVQKMRFWQKALGVNGLISQLLKLCEENSCC